MRVLFLTCLTLLGGCTLLFEAGTAERPADGDAGVDVDDAGQDVLYDGGDVCPELIAPHQLSESIVRWEQPCGIFESLAIDDLSAIDDAIWSKVGNLAVAGPSLDINEANISADEIVVGDGAIVIELGVVPQDYLQFVTLSGSGRDSAQFHRAPGYRQLHMFHYGIDTPAGRNETCAFDTAGNNNTVKQAISSMHLIVQTRLAGTDLDVQFTLDDRVASESVTFRTFRLPDVQGPLTLTIKGRKGGDVPMYLHGVSCPSL